MSRAQRLTFLAIAAVVLVVAVAVLSGGGGDGAGGAPTATATPAGTPRAGASAEPTATPTPTQAPIPVLDGKGIERIEATQGDTVRFRVTATSPQEIHVHGYDLKANAAPGKPARFSFKATIAGRFEIEYEGPGQQIGELEVQPG
jgi:FtsP/CotA-like multicopper oxidase with cupredoxin domain